MGRNEESKPFRDAIGLRQSLLLGFLLATAAAWSYHQHKSLGLGLGIAACLVALAAVVLALDSTEKLRAVMPILGGLIVLALACIFIWDSFQEPPRNTAYDEGYLTGLLTVDEFSYDPLDREWVWKRFPDVRLPDPWTEAELHDLYLSCIREKRHKTYERGFKEAITSSLEQRGPKERAKFVRERTRATSL